MFKFYVFDLDSHLVCILIASRFIRIKGQFPDLTLLFFVDSSGNEIAYFDDSKFIVRDNPDVSSEPSLFSEVISYD